MTFVPKNVSSSSDFTGTLFCWRHFGSRETESKCYGFFYFSSEESFKGDIFFFFKLLVCITWSCSDRTSCSSFITRLAIPSKSAFRCHVLFVSVEIFRTFKVWKLHDHAAHVQNRAVLRTVTQPLQPLPDVLMLVPIYGTYCAMWKHNWNQNWIPSNNLLPCFTCIFGRRFIFSR